MRDLIPHLAQKFTHAPLTVFLWLRLLSLYAVREMVFIKGGDALFNHLDTTAQVDSIDFKTALFRLVHFLDESELLSLLVER